MLDPFYAGEIAVTQPIPAPTQPILGKGEVLWEAQVTFESGAPVHAFAMGGTHPPAASRFVESAVRSLFRQHNKAAA